MKYFIISILFLIAVAGVQALIVKISPDHSIQSGLRRAPPRESQTKQAQEEKTSFDVQREGRNQVPRH